MEECSWTPAAPWVCEAELYETEEREARGWLGSGVLIAQQFAQYHEPQRSKEAQGSSRGLYMALGRARQRLTAGKGSPQMAWQNPAYQDSTARGTRMQKRERQRPREKANTAKQQPPTHRRRSGLARGSSPDSEPPRRVNNMAALSPEVGSAQPGGEAGDARVQMVIHLVHVDPVVHHMAATMDRPHPPSRRASF